MSENAQGLQSTAAWPRDPWQEGQYVTYFATSEGGAQWRATSIHAMQKIGQDKWELLVFTRVADRDFMVVAETSEKTLRNTSDMVMPTAVGNLRGTEPDEEEVMAVVADCANMFGSRFSSKLTEENPSPLSASLACGLNQVLAVPDPWPELGQERTHYMNSKIFLTGLARTESADGKTVKKLTSFGVNNPKVHYEKLPYSFVDLTNIAAVSYDEFKIRMPATWFLQAAEKEGELEKPNGWLAKVGGNDHACTVQIRISREGSAETYYQQQREELSKPYQIQGAETSREYAAPQDFEQGLFSIDLVDMPKIQGARLCGLYRSLNPQISALITANVLFAKQSPAKEEMAASKAVLKDIVETFELQ